MSGSPGKQRLSRVEQRGGHTPSPPIFQTLPVHPSATTPQSMASKGRPWSQTVHGSRWRVSSPVCANGNTSLRESADRDSIPFISGRPEGPLETRGLSQAKTLGSWGCRVWTSQPTCLGKSTPSRAPTPCPRLTAQARPRHQGQAAVFHACWDHRGGSEWPVEWSPRCLIPQNTVQGRPAGQQRVDITACLPAGRPHQRGTAGAPPR